MYVCGLRTVTSLNDGRAIADLCFPRVLVTRGDLQSLKDDWLTDNVRVTDKQNNTAVIAELTYCYY